MKQINNNERDLLQERISYGLDLSFNKLIDEKRRNGEDFVFAKNGKPVFVNANDVDYRKIKEPT